MTDDLCLHLICPYCHRDIEVGPMSPERRRALVRELQEATRKLTEMTT
jgi:hypothetical protein